MKQNLSGVSAEWIEKVMVENQFSYEVIYVDDGSTDNFLASD